MKKLGRLLRFAIIGWIAGTLFILTIGLAWPAIFPGITRPAPTTVAPVLSLSNSIFITLVITSLPALLGGLVGGRLPREGGHREQWFAAAMGGILLSAPFGCFNFWLLSGA
jgi:hypothetical protein